MKHLIQFEKWSPKFNRTLQGAYQQAEVTNKGFGKSAKSVLDYANRSISQEVFTIETTSGNKVEIVHNPEFILKPIQTFIKYNGGLSKDKGYIVLPIKYSEAEKEKHLASRKGTEREIKQLKEDFDLVFKDGKIYAISTSRESTPLPTPKMELRFSDRKSIEDFFAMIIQAVLSSPEKVSQPNPFRNLEDFFPGDTVEKQTILQLIQKLILDKDHRQYTM